MLNNVHVWWLGWPILEHLDLLRFQELWCGVLSMRRSTILLKNLPSLVVWNVMGSKNCWCCHTTLQISCTPLCWMYHQTMIFPPSNLTVFWVNLGSMQVQTGLLQYLRWLGCSSMDDSSEKSTFCHFSTFHPFCRLWALANGTRNFYCLLFNAGLWAVIQPWRPLHERIHQTVLVDTGVSGDQFSCSSAGVRKGLALDSRSNKQSSQTVVLQGLPDLGLSWTSPVSSNLFVPVSTWRLDTWKLSATSAADLVFRLLMISTLVCGRIFGMLIEGRLHFTWRSGVPFFLFT